MDYTYIVIGAVLFYAAGSLSAVVRLKKFAKKLEDYWNDINEEIGQTDEKIIKNKWLMYIVCVVFSWLAYCSLEKLLPIYEKGE